MQAVQEFNALNQLVAEEPKPPAKKPIPPEFLKPLVNAELSFVHRVCEPTEEQMKAIVESAQDSLEGMVDILDPKVRGRTASTIQYRGLDGQRLNQNPVRRIREDTMEYLPLLLSDEQYQKYKQESSQRERFEQEAASDYLAALVTYKLTLSKSQQRKLREVFLEEWPDLDSQWVVAYIDNQRFVPIIPSNLLRKVLTTEQQVAWASFQQVNISVMLGQNAELFLEKEWLP
nr:hypothetical protein [Rhodopirellula europaea]